MSDLTPNLNLPYIVPDQAQKHVTHNEALQRLDALVQLVLQSIVTALPVNAADGSSYLVSASPGATLEGKANQIAHYIDGDWSYITPVKGWTAFLLSSNTLLRFDGATWVIAVMPAPADSQFQSIGINASADAANRFAISAAATLFNHEGGSHQMKLNRGADGATGTILFQTGFSGRFELGQAGDMNFSLKASPNGTVWKTGMSIDTSGVVRMPGQPVCRAALNAATLTPAANSFTGFQTLPVNQGGFALGAAVSPGTGQKLVVPATGLYALTLNALALSSQGHTISVIQNAATVIAALKGTANTINTTHSQATLVQLTQGDLIQCQHSGSAQIDFGPGKTEMMLQLL